MAVLKSIEEASNSQTLKLTLDHPISSRSTASYGSGNPPNHYMLARILQIEGVVAVHLDGNVITLEKTGRVPWDMIIREVGTILSSERTRPDSPSDTSRLDAIEILLNNSVRPYMWDDGGDVELLHFEHNNLHVRFVGACRECPHAQTSTLQAIQAVVHRFDRTIELVDDTHVQQP